MSFKPGDLFFGLMEFLAFIVPGFILCITLPFILHYPVKEYVEIKNDTVITFFWVSLVLVSYITGHFLHHICALVLNPVYKNTYLKWKIGKHIEFVTKVETQIDQKIPILSDHLKKAEAYVKMNSPVIIPELEKHEANSKLFRSLCLLSLYLCLLPCLNWYGRAVLIIISFLSFSKFANERWNHRYLVYQYFNLIN
ncbi:hypothetical protein [Flavobacterium sp. UBA7680]|uniref:hypothetical protein n=1 Tax=Flavobacterium sp. UBA7680 TaxID=1946559 RepID=UPI0025BCF1D8|nr:hypothetical protein [Flavobacterium sp. UBA7680]